MEFVIKAENANGSVTIELSESVCTRCGKFADVMGENNQAHEFNNRFTGRRTPTQIRDDHYYGKVAECAVHWYLSELGVDLEDPDFEVYGGEAQDAHDLKTATGLTISIKGTKKGTRLMVHTGQLQQSDCDLYIACQVPEADKGRTVSILGFAVKRDLVNPEKVKEYREAHNAQVESQGQWKMPLMGPDAAGSRATYHPVNSPMPWATQIPFQAPNFVIGQGQLRTDWKKLADALNKPRPSGDSSRQTE